MFELRSVLAKFCIAIILCILCGSCEAGNGSLKKKARARGLNETAGNDSPNDTAGDDSVNETAGNGSPDDTASSASPNETAGNGSPKEIEVSSRLISSVCALHSKYQEDKQMPSEPLKTMPQGLPLLDTKCDTWARACGEDCDKWTFEKESKCKYEKQKGARIIGGADAELGDAPWDLHFRFIYDWDGTQGSSKKFTQEEIATNNVSRIKEQHRCTGIFYTKNFVLTTAWCGYMGKRFALTRNRFVGWLARQRFLVMTWCIYKSDVNKQQTCDITFHPEFVSFEDDPNLRKFAMTTNPEIQHRDHDISIIKFHQGFDFKHYPHTRAILLAQPGMEFEGKAIFAGWGTTDDKYSHSSLSEAGHGGAVQRKGQITKLQKIELTIIPFEPKCKKLIHKYLEKGAGDLDPKYDYSQRYICAEPTDGTKQGLCGGDIGGALVCDKDGKKYVCGLKNSWGATVDCVKDQEGVEIFLKMSHYTPWVESTAGQQSASDLNP